MLEEDLLQLRSWLTSVHLIGALVWCRAPKVCRAEEVTQPLNQSTSERGRLGASEEEDSAFRGFGSGPPALCNIFGLLI